MTPDDIKLIPIIHYSNEYSRVVVCGAKLRRERGGMVRRYNNANKQMSYVNSTRYVDTLTSSIKRVNCTGCLAWLQDWIVGRIGELEKVAST